MNTFRASLFSIIGILAPIVAYADAPAASVSPFGGQVGAVAPRALATHPTPLFTVGGLAFGIWARVPPPYNVAANRNLADNPF